jgi:copper chaperone NosL
MYDFYQWGYDYGHNLDPTAPIQVPGLSYQPPLFGHKRLLNFDAYSLPDVGGWIVIAAAVLAFAVSCFFHPVPQRLSLLKLERMFATTVKW